MRRRDCIIYVLASLIGAFCGLALFLIRRYFLPPKKPFDEPMRVEGWVPVAYIREVTPGSSKEFVYGNIPGVIINDAGEMSAFSLICSHFGCVVNWLPDRDIFSCPCHGGEFNSDGTAISGPPKDSLNQFDIQVKADRIYVKPAWHT
ncbi:MAG: ubiquinol-cytochrome c reductase iron-sulfur subunit [Deltaproteobacteria bacterium]|nr:ubiquinol-cytochrome c reductase iron-sulfur subunit [Deltaproteobacteria bacterium]MBW1861626.1 ubiquinol-cytochrome c reductase iron-sulfur subunit [Deltaproteobacteria bacterium]